MFDPLVDSAIIGVIGIIVSVFGYAFQNWQVKKAERERAEDVIKREKYEEWIKTMVNGLHIGITRKEKVPMEFLEKLDEANNMIELYGSDEVVKAVMTFWKGAQENNVDLAQILKQIVLAMRKDLVDTSLGESDVALLRVGG